jgi:hypothetical protein
MEMHKVSLKDIRPDPLAHELATSEGMQPFVAKVFSTVDEGYKEL